MYSLYAILLAILAAALWVGLRWYQSRKWYADPFNSKLRQAANLRWTKVSEITKDGEAAIWAKRSVRFVRGDEEAVLWQANATITLMRLYIPFDFDDFMELEEFISEHPREPDLDETTDEQKYLREVELFFVRHGYRDRMLGIQATDYKFLVSFGELIKAGYARGEDSVVVAALTLHAVQFYEQDRERSIRWLTQTADDYRAQSRGDKGRD